jgi:O-Antigen ligase
MTSTIRQHAGAGFVAAATVTSAFSEGLFEPTGYAAASVVLWAAVIAGLASRTLPVAPVGRTAAFAGLCLAAVVFLATASVGWASDQGLAFEEAVRISFYLGLFALAACTASRAGRAEWIAGLTVGLGGVSMVALIAYLQPGLLHDGTSEIPNAAGRLAYPIGYWNGAGALLAIAGVLFAYAGMRAPSRALRSLATTGLPVVGLGIWLASSRGGAVAVVLGLIVLIALVSDRFRLAKTVLAGAAGAAALIFVADQMDALASGVTDSAMRADGDRMTLLTLAVCALTAGLAWLLDGVRPAFRVNRRLGIAAAVLVAAVAIAGIVAADPAKRFDEFKAPPSMSTGTPVGAAGLSSNGRWQFWSAAVDAFERNPVGGVGVGGYEDWWARHADVPLFVRNPHSLPLQIAAELGIAGLAFLVGFLAALVLAARRRLAAGLGGDTGVLVAVLLAAAVGAAFDWTWKIPAVFGGAVICAALLTSSAPSRRLRQDGYWLGIGTVGAAWLAIVAAGLVVLSQIELDQSRDAAAQQRFDAGINSAKDAHTVLPWSAEPYTQLALLYEARGDIGNALSELRNAERRDSQDWRLPLIEARLQTRRGDLPAARMALARARTLSPELTRLAEVGRTSG